MKSSAILLIFLISFYSNAQDSKRVFFLGNSYTYYNDLPGLLSQAADSAGDTVIHDDNTPPNVGWINHVSDILTTTKIMQGNWDYVIMQEAGRKTGRSEEYVMDNVYPYANELNNLVEEYNPCGETLFYCTWGERNGVPSECPVWPPFCTYEDMDNLITERHLIMAENYEAEVSPVGAVWRFIRENHPGIDLYDPDGSHPSLAGSYAGAITFYTSIFKKDPTLVSFNSTLSPSEANIIREAVRFVVYDNLSDWFIGSHQPISSFEITNNGNLEYAFINNSEYSNDFLWLFGDGGFSTEENPTHTYDADG
ncbi:MAG: PKD domain-containing protein, partial [Flavobacteriaceae bacterium]|nr:PKD domain-containing protein [Flavobacteriaceae bacterium]